MKRGLLVLHQGAIGDFVLTMAVVQAVREALDFNHVIVIASAPAARVSAGRSAIDEWHSPENVGLHRLFLEDGEIDDRLRRMLDDADLVLNLLGDSSSLPHRHLVRHCPVISVDPRPTMETQSSGRHITQQWIESIRSAGFAVGEPSPPRIQIDCNVSKNQVVIHPGSGGIAKCWPVQKYISIADSLAHLNVNWMLGPAELESGRFDAIKRRAVEKHEPLICEHDVLAALHRIAGAALYIGNDAGMTHLAAAIGLPTIAIFGPTDPRVWRPLNPDVHIVGPTGRAIEHVGIDQVLAAVHARLGMG
jgi:heptosyltransferase III